VGIKIGKVDHFSLRLGVLTREIMSCKLSALEILLSTLHSVKSEQKVVRWNATRSDGFEYILNPAGHLSLFWKVRPQILLVCPLHAPLSLLVVSPFYTWYLWPVCRLDCHFCNSNPHLFGLPHPLKSCRITCHGQGALPAISLDLQVGCWKGTVPKYGDSPTK